MVLGVEEDVPQGLGGVVEAATSVEGRRSVQRPCPHAADHELEVVSDEKFSKQPRNVIGIANSHFQRTTLLNRPLLLLILYDITTDTFYTTSISQNTHPPLSRHLNLIFRYRPHHVTTFSYPKAHSTAPRASKATTTTS